MHTKKHWPAAPPEAERPAGKCTQACAEEPVAEERLIEEILQAAGLEQLD